MSHVNAGAASGMGVPPVFGGPGNAQSGDIGRDGYATPRPMRIVAEDVAAGESSEERAVQLRREANTPGACCATHPRARVIHSCVYSLNALFVGSKKKPSKSYITH